MEFGRGVVIFNQAGAFIITKLHAVFVIKDHVIKISNFHHGRLMMILANVVLLTLLLALQY